MKPCFKCGVVKHLDDFYKHSMMSDGRLNKCKECTKKDVSANYRANVQHFKDYDVARNKTEKRKAHYTALCKTKRTKYPIKYAANTMVGNAIREGKLKKPLACECCKKEKPLDGHHCDYSKPLDVMWLCRQCHNDWHKTNIALNGDQQCTQLSTRCLPCT